MVEFFGMEDCDVILIINDYIIIDWDDISIVIDNMFVGENIKVIYMWDNWEIIGI